MLSLCAEEKLKKLLLLLFIMGNITSDCDYMCSISDELLIIREH